MSLLVAVVASHRAAATTAAAATLLGAIPRDVSRFTAVVARTVSHDDDDNT